MVHLILTGATGLVGSGVLHAMLQDSSVTKLSLLSRRAVQMAEGHEKAEVIIHKDFKSYPPEILDKLKGADGCVWALGISQSEVDKDKYKEITYDYAVEFVKAFDAVRPEGLFKFVYVSGEGSTTTPSAWSPYFAKIKGAAESTLLQFGKDHPTFKFYTVRPGMIDSTYHPEIHNFIPRQTFGRKLAQPLFPVARTLIPSLVAPTKEMGQAFTDLAKGDGAPLEGEGVSLEGRAIANKRIRILGGLK